MPQVNELKNVNLDNYKIIDNNTSTFVYFTYPSTNCKFTGMISEKDGSYHNVMSFTYNSTSPNIFISNNKNFTDLDQYTATSFVITQKIHSSIRLTKGTKNDLVLIMEHTPGKNNRNTAKLYVYYFLTPDPNVKSGGDFNTIFEKLDSTYKIMTQTNDFETMNLKNYTNSFNLDSGIMGQFGQNTTDAMTSLCFTFIDSKQNNHIIMQPPIPISSTIFTDINNFLSQMKSKVMQHPIDSFFTNTDLTPTENVTTNVLMKRYNDLSADQKVNPLTPTQKVEAAGDAVNNSRAGKAEEVEKKQGFTTLNTLREGVSFSCRPADSSTDQTATVVTSTDPTSSTTAMQSMILAMVYIGITVGMYLFAPGIYIDTVLWDTRAKDGKKQNILTLLAEMVITPYIQGNIEARVARISLVSWFVGLFFIILFIIFWSVGLAAPNIPDGTRWFFVVYGFLLVVVCFLNTFSLQNYYTNGQMIKQMALLEPNLNRGTANTVLEAVFVGTPFYKWYSG